MNGGNEMSEVQLTVHDSTEMHRLGAALAQLCEAGDVVVLTGELGAGKTTLTRGFGEALGVRGTVASPTFVIARTHPSLIGGPALIHVDAYRLNSALELDDLDLDLDASITVIEWGAEMVSALTSNWLEVVIDRPTGDPAGDDELEQPRHVTVRTVGERWQATDLDGLAARIR